MSATLDRLRGLVKVNEIKKSPKTTVQSDITTQSDTTTPAQNQPRTEFTKKELMDFIMHLMSNPESFNAMLLDELQFRSFLRLKNKDCSESELKLKIAAIQRFGVYLRVAESENIRLGNEKNTQFLKDNQERSFSKFSISPTETKRKLSKPRAKMDKMDKKTKFFTSHRALNLPESTIENLWNTIHGSKK